MLLLSHSDVVRLLPMADCMPVVSEALSALARGDALLPLRAVMRLPDGRSALATMPAMLPRSNALGVKVITVFPDNEGLPLDSHQGVVLLFDGDGGNLLAIMDASSITAIRTAAVSGVATSLLAAEGPAELAILGSGVQARTHLEAMCVARPVRRVRVWSRTRERADTFVEWAASRFPMPVEAAPSARAAVDGATIICTVTASAEPVLEGRWLSPGAHINAVGSSTPRSRELDSAAVVRSRLFVDRRESALHEAGDFLIPRSEGAISDGHIIAELGELLVGSAQGRQHGDEITLFKSLGIAVEDVAVARHLLERASASGVGAVVDLHGGRHAPA
ncbi:MAG: ornithine cyclodeaminase family protein [Gemmatimonadota bacterium]|nr:ornithine cyclodeaminase family protein [Gemmatimonadota bacterium]